MLILRPIPIFHTKFIFHTFIFSNTSQLIFLVFPLNYSIELEIK